MSDNNILISIIIPTYNMEEYISKCLDSILVQKTANIEVLCINDGSTDGSEKIAKKYQMKDARVKIISKKNSGVSSARNVGLKNARGKYIAWCDPDDYFSEDWLDSLKEYLDCNIDVILFGARLVGFRSNRFLRYRDKSSYIEKNDFISDIGMGRKIQSYLWSMVIKKELWIGIRFSEKISLYEDLSTLHKVVEKGNSFFYLDKKLYNYVKHSRNMTSTENFSMLDKIEDYITRTIIYKRRFNYLNKRRYKVSRMSYIAPICFFIINYLYASKNIRNCYKRRYRVYIKIVMNNKVEIIKYILYRIIRRCSMIE